MTTLLDVAVIPAAVALWLGIGSAIGWLTQDDVRGSGKSTADV